MVSETDFLSLRVVALDVLAVESDIEGITDLFISISSLICVIIVPSVADSERGESVA